MYVKSEVIQENHIQDSRSPGQDVNWPPHKYMTSLTISASFFGRYVL